MVKTIRNARRRERNPRRYRRAVLALALVAGAGVAIWIAGSLYNRVSPVTAALPSLDLAGLDPAVARAIDVAQTAVRASPGSAAAWGRLGMVLRAHEYNAEANTCFAQAERLDPRDPHWPYYQGTDPFQSDLDLAVAKLRRSVELAGAKAPASLHLRFGELLFNQNQLKEAEDQFQQVLKRTPANPVAHLNLARIARQQDKLEEAKAHINQASADVHTRKAAHLLAAEIQQGSGPPNYLRTSTSGPIPMQMKLMNFEPACKPLCIRR
jgi:tetratricopeptide (TPR) repeat protein